MSALELDLAALVDVAQAATQGPWERDSGWSVTATPPEGWSGPYVIVETKDRNDALFAATFDPPTVLALIERLRVAESWLPLITAALSPAQPAGGAG